MPYYISEYEGDGVDEWLGGMPFRPYTGKTPREGWKAIDLRPDLGLTLEGGGLNACLMWHADNITDPKLTKFAEDKDEIVSLNTKQILESRLILPVNYFELSKAENLVSELLINPPPNAWTAIKPTHKRIMEVHLGPINTKIPETREKLELMFKYAPMFLGFLALAFGDASFFSTIITEDFNGANQSPMTGHDLSWTQFNASGQIDIDTNQCHWDTGSQGYARADSDLASDDHYSEITWVDTGQTDSGNASGVITRKAGGDTVTTLYRHRANQAATGTILEKKVSDATTTLDSGGSDPTDGDKITGKADGSTITLDINDSEILTGTDSAITGNVRCGIFIFHGSSIAVIMDNYEAGDLAAPAAPPGQVIRNLF
jgi:hypothetical protein